MVEEKKEEKPDSGRIAVVRVRGITGIKRDIKRTLSQLRLYRKNYCVVVPSSKSSIGMVRKVKDYVTWGEIDDNIYKTLVEKKGEEYKDRATDSRKKIDYGSRFVEVDGKKIKKFFRLNSPRKGYGKSIKLPYSRGGALGYRKGKIVDLIKRMI